MTETVEAQLSETREIIALLVKMDRAFADTMTFFDECAKDLKTAHQERDEARAALAAAEAWLSQEQHDRRLIGEAVAQWGAPGGCTCECERCETFAERMTDFFDGLDSD